jgi:hypothetical protein
MAEALTGKKWDAYSYVVIGFLLLLLVGRWPLLPNFIDIYYHLACAQGFIKAGGFVAHDFWSYAPLGRPHLYPPLSHFLLAGLLQSGLTALAVARLADVIIFPAFVLVLWFFARSLFGSRCAFFCVLVSSSLYSFYLASSNFLAATLAFMLGILSLWAQERNKTIAAVILLSLCFYAHAQAPWFFILVYILYGIIHRQRFIRCLGIAAGGMILSLPVIVHLFRNRTFYAAQAAHENFVLEINLYLLLAFFSFNGIPKSKHRYYLIVVLALSALPFLFGYPYRYASGQGMMGFVVLSAIACERVYEKARGLCAQRGVSQGAVLLVFVVVFIFLSPGIIMRKNHPAEFSLINATYVNLIRTQAASDRPNDFSVSGSRHMRQLVAAVRSHTQEGDIIYTNFPFAGTIISALAHRADAQGMLAEVRPGGSLDPLAHANLVVWFKSQQGKANTDLEQIVSRYGLERVAETDIAFVLRNNAATSKEQPRKADLPWAAVLAIGACVVAVLVWDLARPQNIPFP